MSNITCSRDRYRRYISVENDTSVNVIEVRIIDVMLRNTLYSSNFTYIVKRFIFEIYILRYFGEYISVSKYAMIRNTKNTSVLSYDREIH